LGYSNGSIFIWNWLTQTVLETLQGDMASYPALKFLYNGLLAASSPYGLIHVWNLTNSSINLTLWENAYCIEQLSNGNLATVGSDKKIQIFSNGNWLNSLTSLTNRQYCLKQVASSTQLASCDESGQITVESR
jgi:WD40 repeat protein